MTMTQILHIRLLGEFSLTRNDERLTTVNTPRLQSLLAYLVLHRDTPQARQHLAFLLWPDSSESQARTNLRNLIHQLRQALPQADVFLCAENTTIQWRADAPCTLDVADLRATLARPATRSDLEQAVALYRGDLLPSCYDDWIMPEREQLRQTFVDALQRLIELLEQTRDYTAAIRHAQQLLQQDPLCEETYRWLMRLHAANDDHASALRIYHTCVTTLQAELGAEPAPATHTLYRSIIANSLPVSPVQAAFNQLPLVGRQSEWKALQAAWQTAASGQSHCVILSGEAGVGKTRLARELAIQVQMAHGTSLVGECYAEGGAPYAAFAQMILTTSYWPSDLSQLLLADLISLAPGLRVRCPDVPPNPPLDPQAEQQRLYESAFTFFANLANHTPLLLVLEDVHWADGGSLALVRSLARRFRQTRTPVLIVLTFREVELTEHKGLADLLTNLNRERLATPLKLHRLDRAGTQAMLEALFAGAVTADFADRIYQETEGNPFFIEEMCKALIAGGQVYRENGGWQRRSTTSIEMPRSIRMAIEARLAALPETGQDVLRLAAVLGRRFEFDVLQRADPDKDEESLIAALEKAEQAQLLNEIGRGGGITFEFAHALIPATLVEGLSGMRRRRLHWRALAALEKLHPEDYKVLAHHCLEASEDDKAVEYLLKAGDQARGLYAYQEAIDTYEQAVALLKEQGEHDRAARTLMSLGLMYHTTLDFRRSRQAYQEGFALWQRASQVQSEVSRPPAPHAFRMNWPEVVTLDPTLADDLSSASMSGQLFSGLVELQPDMDIVPDVARSWEVLEGGRKYVFRLREDVCWSDGKPVMARDFEYAWKRVLDPATGSQNAELLYDVQGARAFHQGDASTPDGVGVRALEDLTLVVELEAPTGYFLNLLAYTPTFPVPRHIVEQHGAIWTDVSNIVSNGPFKLEAWQPGQSIILTRNPGYHGRFGGNVQHIEVCLLKEEAVTLQMYEAGGLDVWWGSVASFAELERVRQRHAREYFSVSPLATFYAGFDLSRPPFDDARVRRALVQATDRELLADVILRGYGSPATGGFVPPGMPGHSPGIGLPYNPERARQLLAQAGYPGGRGFPAVAALTPHEFAEAPQAMLAQWRENLGVEIGWEMFPWTVYFNRLHESLPHLFYAGWVADYPDPDNFLRVGLGQFCRQHWSASFDEMVEQARRSTDQTNRMKLYQAADRILIEEAVVMPITYGRGGGRGGDLLVKPWVKKHPTSPFGGWFWKDVVMEPHA
jgi:ABC-type oligopeptide transport system substrate-binding subunit/DNA-binding SARP family transcriptional activator